MRVVAFVVLSVSLAACSSTPTTGSAPESAAIPPPPPVAIPDASAAGTVPATKTEAAPPAASAEKGGKIPSGYRLEKRNGKEFYCRNITTLGSRFPQKTCFTRSQLEEIQRRTESTMGSMEQNMKVCSGETCTSN